MIKNVRWVHASTLLAICAGCGSLPDWSGVQAKLAEGRGTDSGGMTSSGGDTALGGSTAIAGSTSNVGGNVSTGGGTPIGGTGPMTGGTGGATTGGGSAMGGSGGGGPDQTALDKAELADALKVLNGYVYTTACKFGMNGQDVTTLNGCGTSDICWSTADFGEFAESRTIAIGGTPGHVYQVDLGVLGVIEPRDYPAFPNCSRLPGQPADTVGVAQCADGFANKSGVTFNVWEFNIPTPAAKYYLNAVVTHPPHRVDKSDNRFTFKVAAGTTIKFTMDDLNGGLIRNCTNAMSMSKYMTADGKPILSSMPAVYNGQWMQLTVLSAKVIH